MKGYRPAATVVRDERRDRLIAEHVDMAQRIAARIGRRVPAWLRDDDLVGAALIGLTEAAGRYDLDGPIPFVAFAERRIRGAVLDELRRGDIMPRRVRQDARNIGRVIAKLEQKLGGAPSDEQIAAALGVSLDEYHDELEVLTQVSFVDWDEIGLDQHLGRANDNGGAAAELERRQLGQALQQAVGELPERDAQILSLYYVEELTYAEVAEVLGVSESRVCQLHARALARLKAAMHEEGNAGE